MAHVKIRCGLIEMQATGNNELIAQERGAFVDFLKHKLGEDMLAAQRRREARQPGKQPETAVAHQGLAVTMRKRRDDTIDLTELRNAIRSGRGPEVIRQYDELDVPLDTGGAVTVVCAYVDERMARFVFKDCWDEHVMNEEATNKGGYRDSKGRKHVLEDIYPHLPPELRDVIAPRRIVETIDGERVEYADPLWLPSATDMFGPSEEGWWPDEPDSFQLPIFKTERDRVKECGDNGTYPYYLRSVNASSAANFRRVITNGTGSSNGAYISSGFAPGFDIA